MNQNYKITKMLTTLMVWLFAGSLFAHVTTIRVNQNQDGSLTWYLESYHTVGQCGIQNSGLNINGVQYPLQTAFSGNASGLSSNIFAHLSGYTIYSYAIVNTPYIPGTLNVQPYSNNVCWAFLVGGNGSFTPPPPPVCSSFPVTNASSTIVSSNDNGTPCLLSDDMATVNVNVTHLVCGDITGDGKFSAYLNPAGSNTYLGEFAYNSGNTTSLSVNINAGTSNVIRFVDNDFSGNNLDHNIVAFPGVTESTPPVVTLQNVTIQLDASGNATIATVVPNSTVFYEDFSSDANQTTSGSITNWNTLGGGIDVGNFNSSIPGKEVDLSSTSNGGIESIQNFSLSTGNYELTFDYIRNNTDDPFTVSVGSLASQSYNSTSSLQSGVLTFTVGSASSAKIKFLQGGTSDANGTFVGNIRLVKLGTTNYSIVNGITDNCGIASVSVSQSNFTCADAGSNNVTVTATDHSGNITTQSATVTVQDQILPTLSCPGNITTNTEPGICGAYVSFAAATASNNCGAPAISYSHQSGDFFPSGTSTVLVTATDASGNASTCSFTVTVNDIEKPNISCPFDIVVNTEAGQCGATISYNAPSATDNCGTGNLPTSISGYSYQGMLNGHTYFLSDVQTTPEAAHAAAIALGGHLVTITSYQENVFVSNFSSDKIWIGLTDRDSEGTWKWITSEPVTYTNWAGGEPNNFGGNEDWAVINWTGTNPDWNDWFYTQPAYYAVEFDGGTLPTTLVSGPANGSFVSAGIHTVVYQATDPSGNTEQCSFTVTVNDNEAPAMVTNNITVNLTNRTSNPLSQADIDLLGLNSSDNCAVFFDIISGQTNYNCGNIGQTFNLILRGTDPSGNSASVPVTVTVADPNSVCNDPPVAACQNITIYTDASCTASIVATDVDGGSSDPDGDALTYTVNNSGPFGVGSHTVTLTVSDGEYTDNCTAIVTVMDNTPPTAICQNVTIQLDANGNASIQNAGGPSTLFFEDWTADANGYYNNQSTTNWNVTSDIDLAEYVAGIAGKEIDLAGFTNSSIETQQSFTFTPGNYTFSFQHITNTYSDNSVQVIIGGLVNQTFSSTYSIQTASVNFTVSSTTSTTIKMVQLGSSNSGGSFIGQIHLVEQVAPALAIENGSNDACGIAGITASQTSFDCSHVGSNNVTLTVTDVNGNTSTCTSVVTVIDNVAPIALTQNITVQLDANGQASITETDIDNGSNDACGIASTSLDNYNFSCSDAGANTVTLTVTDNNSNVSSQTAIVTVEDNVAPVALTQNITVQLDANGQASITESDIDNGSNDACGIASTSLDNYNFSCADVGNNTVTLTVTDNNGNASTATATVTVEDNIAPVISGMPSNISVVAQPNDCTPSVSWTAPTASDNCTLSLTSSHNPGDNFAVGTTTVSYTATDASNNSVSASFTVTVTPTPLVSTIGAATFAGGYNISCNGFSDGSIDLNISGGCLPYTYSWSNGATTEDVGNLSAGTYSVDITDANGTTISESITLTEPTPLTVSGTSSGYLSGNGVTGTTLYIGYGPQSINLSASATGGVGPYSYSWSPSASLSGANTDSPVASPTQTTTYTVTATDQNGCTATFDVTVDVIDATCGKNNQNKVYVCHRTGNANKGYSYHNICISVNAVQTHLNHGDYLGPCNTSSKMAGEEDELDELHYHIYPNPTSGITNIELEMDSESDINIMIFDMTGKLLEHISETAVEGHSGYQVDMSTYAKGVYLVKIQSGDKVQTERLIKE